MISRTKKANAPRWIAAVVTTALAAAPVGASAQESSSPAPQAEHAAAQAEHAAPQAEHAAPQAEQAAARPAARRKASLREALGLAARQGPEVAAARAQAQVTEVSVERAWSAWKPDISASGTFDHTSAPQRFDFAPLAQLIAKLFNQPAPPASALPPATEIVGPNSRYGTIQIAQPLFTPAGVFLIPAAKAGAEAAARGADEAREQVLLNVARTYLGLQGLEGLLAAAHDAEKIGLRREADARLRIQAGTAVEIALLRAQTETAQARTQIASLEGQRESLLALLEGLVGEPIEPGAGAADKALGTPGDEAQTPWERTFQVQSAIAQVRAAQGLIRYDNYQWLPTVAAVAKGNYNSNTGFSGTNTSYDLILNVSIPLYDRGLRYVAKHEDEAKLAQAQATLAAARARARSAWAGARANLAAAAAVLAQSEAQAQLAAKAQAQIEVAAKAGVATSLDLSDADNQKFAAQSAAAQARAALEIRRAEVAAAEGRLFHSTEQ